jgi:hypothetical protein
MHLEPLLCFSVVNIINLLLHNSTILPLSIMLLQLNSTKQSLNMADEKRVGGNPKKEVEDVIRGMSH